jgi:hypothetical protein
MVNEKLSKEDIADELGRIVFKIDSTINLLYDGKVIPAHEKLEGVKKIVLNLRSAVLEEPSNGSSQSNR